MTEPEWYRANRANWDERVGVHIGSGGYDLSDLRAGRGKLNAIEEAELPPVEGKRLAHLQCHFGADSLARARAAWGRGNRPRFLGPRNRGGAQAGWRTRSRQPRALCSCGPL